LIVYPVRAVTFDVHGTLIHAPRLGDVYAEILGRHGITIEPETAVHTVRLVWEEFACSRRPGVDLFAAHAEGAKGFWSHFVDRVCLHLELDSPSRFAKAELYQRFAGPDPWETYPEVVEVLEQLSIKGMRCAVISNFDERLPLLLRNLGLSRYFETIVYSQRVGVDKPYPEIFLQALAEMDLPPAEVLHVGDRVREDIEGARGVGMQSVHLARHRSDGDLRDLRPLVELLPDVPRAEETGR